MADIDNTAGDARDETSISPATPSLDLQESETPVSPIEQALRDEPCSFEFFQAVALLQRLSTNQSQPVGQFCNPEEEAVQFRVNNSLGFPASQIQGIEWGEDRPPQMKVNFMGLTGPSGVLPYAYTELILERLRAKDGSLQDFLDLFNHRMISFFYRAWEKYRFPVTYYRGNDVFRHHLLDFIGLGTAGLQNRQAVSDDALLHYVALFSEQARSAEALEAILGDYFEVPVEIEQFAGSWYRLDPSAQCCMDDNPTDSEKLGAGVVVGDEIWHQESRVRIKLGPLSLSRYQDFLPSGAAYEPLKAMVKFFSNDQIDFEVMLILNREEVPPCEVGVDDGAAPRLGWLSWLKSKPLDRNPGDTILSI
jgi:type VI secretion system protein ImpH